MARCRPLPGEIVSFKISPAASLWLSGSGLELKKAMAAYTESGGKGDTIIDQDVVVAFMSRNMRSASGFSWV